MIIVRLRFDGSNNTFLGNLIKVLFRANWVDWVNVTSLDIISNEKRMTIQPTEITEIRNRDVKAFKLGLAFILFNMVHMIGTILHAPYDMADTVWIIYYWSLYCKPNIECGFKMANGQNILSRYQFGEKHWIISTPFYIEMESVLHVL